MILEVNSFQSSRSEKSQSLRCLNFSRAEEDGAFSSSFDKTGVTLISKLCKESIRKKENYRQISLENFDRKWLNKMLINQIQKYIKIMIYCDRVEFFPRIQGKLNTMKFTLFVN